MSLRKVAGLLGAFGLMAGLIGGGVGAQFTDQVTAVQNIHVGTFGCEITDASPTPAAVIAFDKKSVSYTAPDIASSAAGSAPFSFTVTSTGTIPALLHVTQTTPSDTLFTSLLPAPVTDVTLAQNATKTYNAGLQWNELGLANLGEHVSITYTVACTVGPAAQ